MTTAGLSWMGALVVLAGCRPQTGDEVQTSASDTSSTSGTESTSGESSSVPTTGEPPLLCPPCGPEKIHEGDMILDSDADAAGLGCVVRVTGDVLIGEKLTAAGLATLTGLRTIDGGRSTSSNSAPDRAASPTCSSGASPSCCAAPGSRCATS